MDVVKVSEGTEGIQFNTAETVYSVKRKRRGNGEASRMGEGLRTMEDEREK